MCYVIEFAFLLTSLYTATALQLQPVPPASVEVLAMEERVLALDLREQAVAAREAEHIRLMEAHQEEQGEDLPNSNPNKALYIGIIPVYLALFPFNLGQHSS
jgi:hypothetical protein